MRVWTDHLFLTALYLWLFNPFRLANSGCWVNWMWQIATTQICVMEISLFRFDPTSFASVASFVSCQRMLETQSSNVDLEHSHDCKWSLFYFFKTFAKRSPFVTAVDASFTCLKRATATFGFKHLHGYKWSPFKLFMTYNSNINFEHLPASKWS